MKVDLPSTLANIIFWTDLKSSPQPTNPLPSISHPLHLPSPLLPSPPPPPHSLTPPPSPTQTHLYSSSILSSSSSSMASSSSNVMSSTLFSPDLAWIVSSTIRARSSSVTCASCLGGRMPFALSTSFHSVSAFGSCIFRRWMKQRKR